MLKLAVATLAANYLSAATALAIAALAGETPLVMARRAAVALAGAVPVRGSNCQQAALPLLRC